MAALTKLVEVAASLCHYDFPGHRVRESIEENHQFINVHVIVNCLLTIYGHDGNTDKQMEGTCLKIAPTSFP